LIRVFPDLLLQPSDEWRQVVRRKLLVSGAVNQPDGLLEAYQESGAVAKAQHRHHRAAAQPHDPQKTGWKAPALT
jgi:hypothetical protein